jgi:hypothetical protein
MSTDNGGPALQDIRKVIENEDLQSMYRRNDELLSELAEKDARIAELTAEVTRMREALKKIQRLNNWDDKTSAGVKISETYDIARNALREG